MNAAALARGSDPRKKTWKRCDGWSLEGPEQTVWQAVVFYCRVPDRNTSHVIVVHNRREPVLLRPLVDELCSYRDSGDSFP